MRREIDEQFAAYVREHGDHHLRAAVLLTGDWHVVSTSGTVDVDHQGRVRQPDATETLGKTARKAEMTFGDFGVPVSVSAPPSSETVSMPG